MIGIWLKVQNGEKNVFIVFFLLLATLSKKQRKKPQNNHLTKQHKLKPIYITTQTCTYMTKQVHQSSQLQANPAAMS